MRVIGHRGSPATGLPENTLPALDAALAAGADGVEVDVRLSADGVCLLSHDRTLLRVAGLDVPVAFAPYARLRAATVDGVTAAPRVSEVLDLVPPDRRLVCEVKRGEDDTGRVGAGLGRLLRRGGSSGRDLVVSSADVPSLLAVADVAPEVPRALVADESVPVPVAVRRARDLGCAEVHLAYPGLLRALPEVGHAQASGLAVLAWTCDDPDAQRRLRAARVDGVICDDPGAARRAVGPAADAATP